MIGNAHLRPSGPWSYDAGKDEALATLRSAVERCEEYPEFKFTFGEVWALQLVERLDPKLFKRIRRLVKKGQWSISHGTYSLTHPHLLSSEMWTRQITMGHTYCLDKFGKTPAFYINLESKAFPVSHYENLLKAEYKGMVFFQDWKQSEGQESSIFRWINEGGPELLCYQISPHYRTRSHELYGQIMECVEAGSLTLGHTVCFYGVGNHGGGPTKENIEYIRDHRTSFENVELKFSTLEEFFSDALLMSDSFPVHEGPIADVAPGHLLNRRRQKLQQRRAENQLVQAERLCDQIGDKKTVREVERQLDSVWADLMTSANACFSSGKSCDADQSVVDAMQLRAFLYASEWLWNTSRIWSRTQLAAFNYQQIVVLNTLDSVLDSWIEHEPNLDFDRWGRRKLCDIDGNLIPFQLLKSKGEDPNVHRLLFKANIPAKGHMVYLIREFPDIMVDAGGIEEPEQNQELRILKTSMQNAHWTVRVGPRSINRISRSSDKNSNILGKLGISLSSYEDHMDMDAVGMQCAPEVFSAGIESSGWQIKESGELRIAMSNRGNIGNSPFEWKIKMCEGDPRIFCSLKIAFSEAHRHLELNIFLQDAVTQWIDATSAGSQRRDSSEYIHPFHGWTVANGDGSSFAVVSNDFFGFRHNDHCLTLMLLRSPVQQGDQGDESFELSGADDLGVHEFRWIMIPDGEFTKEDLQLEWGKLQQPPVVFDRYEGMNRPPWENSTPVHLQEANEKRALRDGQMTHLPRPSNDLNEGDLPV